MKKVINGNITYYENFSVFLSSIKQAYGPEDAVSWFDRKGNSFTVTYNQLVEDATNLKKYFAQNQLAGRHIALIGENSYQWLLVYLAAALSGGAAVCIDSEQSDEVIFQMIDQADCEAVFLSKGYISLAERYTGKADSFFLLNEDDGLHLNVTYMIREGKGAADGEIPLLPEQTASIVFTSGTTGLSKPVMLSHRALLVNACESNYYVDGGKRAFSSLPFCHTYGMTCSVLATWARGGVLILNGSMRTVMRDLQLSNAFSLLTVPLMVEAIHNQIWLTAKQEGKENGLKQALSLERLKRKLGMHTTSKALDEVRKRALGSLRVIICGGAHMNQEVAEEFELLGLIMLQGYGITECGPLVAVNGNEARKLDSVGMVLPSCQVRLVEEEIYVSGKNLMTGYYKMPEETEAVMEDGWFKTGDIGQIDKDGFLYITGRKKNLIVFKNGKKVSPERLEDLIRQIPLVKDVMVYGATSGISADDVKLAASIYPQRDYTQDMSSYEILESLQREIDKINDTLPLYQQIQMVNIREEDFEKTSMMKIKRHTV